jgi:hypothetical protein
VYRKKHYYFQNHIVPFIDEQISLLGVRGSVAKRRPRVERGVTTCWWREYLWEREDGHNGCCAVKNDDLGHDEERDGWELDLRYILNHPLRYFLPTPTTTAMRMVQAWR